MHSTGIGVGITANFLSHFFAILFDPEKSYYEVVYWEHIGNAMLIISVASLLILKLIQSNNCRYYLSIQIFPVPFCVLI